MLNKNILAVDVGLKRIGLAFYLQSIILPLDPILRQNRNQAAEELDEIMAKKNIQILVVGLPYSVEMRERILHFCQLLKTPVKMVFINEDSTSLESEERLYHLKKISRQNARKNGKLDSLAACQILERYLSEFKG